MAYKAIYTGLVDENDLKTIVRNFLKKYEPGTLINSELIVRGFKKPAYKGATIYICTVAEINYIMNKLVIEGIIVRVYAGTYKTL